MYIVLNDVHGILTAITHEDGSIKKFKTKEAAEVVAEEVQEGLVVSISGKEVKPRCPICGEDLNYLETYSSICGMEHTFTCKNQGCWVIDVLLSTNQVPTDVLRSYGMSGEDNQ